MSSYYQVDRERWAKMTINEQMGNIGSEVGRAIIAHRTGNKDRVERAIDRAVDLFSATVEALVVSANSKGVLQTGIEYVRVSQPQKWGRLKEWERKKGQLRSGKH